MASIYSVLVLAPVTARLLERPTVPARVFPIVLLSVDPMDSGRAGLSGDLMVGVMVGTRVGLSAGWTADLLVPRMAKGKEQP